MDTFERLKRILVDKFDLDPEQVVPESTAESLGLDSLDFIEVLFELEDEFGVRIGDDTMNRPKLDTLADIVKSLDDLVAEQSVAGTAQESASS
jgi:acyl carrier protein